MKFNISSLALAETTTLHLKDPNTGEKLYADEDKKLPLEIVLYGKSSKAYRAALSSLSRKSLARKGKPASFEQNVEDNAELLASISVSANNFDMDGSPIDSKEAFKKLYMTENLYFIRDQVSEELENVESFLQK